VTPEAAVEDPAATDATDDERRTYP